uniref:Queuine tRNA-ribosyltransferase subunit QTRTD1 n=1 Tax=Apis cerana TaxID=7461 RepID=V9IFE6_APICE
MDFTPIWTRKGKCKLTPKEYMDVIEAFKPDVYVALYDGDTKINSSRKRLSNATRRTTTFFEKCFSIHSSSETLKSSEILGVIEGYVIDGLHNNGPDVKDISIEQIKEIVEYTVNLLPARKT